MKTIVIFNAESRQYAMQEVSDLPSDGTMKVTIGKVTSKRSEAQNRLSWLWYGIRGEETGNTPEYEHAFCKLRYGVPIMRRDSEEFCYAYDTFIKPHGYEEKLAFIMNTDFPVTRDMSTKQYSEYLDTIDRESAEFGIQLPHPEDIYYMAMGY